MIIRSKVPDGTVVRQCAQTAAGPLQAADTKAPYFSVLVPLPAMKSESVPKAFVHIDRLGSAPSPNIILFDVHYNGCTRPRKIFSGLCRARLGASTKIKIV